MWKRWFAKLLAWLNRGQEPTPIPPPIPEPPPAPEPAPEPEPVPVPPPPTPDPVPSPVPEPEPEPHPGPNPQPGEAPKLSDIFNLESRDVLNWPVTSHVIDCYVDGEYVIFDHTKAGKWPTWTDPGGIVGEGNIWVVARVADKWYASTVEWLKKGQIKKRLTADGEWALWRHAKKDELVGWVPKKGDMVGFFVSGRARDSKVSTEERSDIAFIEWPY